MLARARARLSRDVFDAADVDNSGAIDKGEFADYIAADPRLLQWLEATGAWWVELGGVIAAREVKEGVARGALGLTGLDIAGCASPEGAAEPTSLLLEAILPQLREVSFHRLVRLVARDGQHCHPLFFARGGVLEAFRAAANHSAALAPTVARLALGDRALCLVPDCGRANGLPSCGAGPVP